VVFKCSKHMFGNLKTDFFFLNHLRGKNIIIFNYAIYVYRYSLKIKKPP